MLVKRARNLKNLRCSTFSTASDYLVNSSKLPNSKNLFCSILRNTNKRFQVPEVGFYHTDYAAIQLFSEKDLKFLETIATMVAKSAAIRLGSNLFSTVQN